MKSDSRSIIIDAAKRWIWLMKGGFLFRTRDVQEHVMGTQILACKDRGYTLSGKPRFHADILSALRELEKDNLVRKSGSTWQRT